MSEPIAFGKQPRRSSQLLPRNALLLIPCFGRESCVLTDTQVQESRFAIAVHAKMRGLDILFSPHDPDLPRDNPHGGICLLELLGRDDFEVKTSLIMCANLGFPGMKITVRASPQRRAWRPGLLAQSVQIIAMCLSIPHGVTLR